jgi:hypothetical protein
VGVGGAPEIVDSSEMLDLSDYLIGATLHGPPISGMITGRTQLHGLQYDVVIAQNLLAGLSDFSRVKIGTRLSKMALQGQDWVYGCLGFTAG